MVIRLQPMLLLRSKTYLGGLQPVFAIFQNDSNLSVVIIEANHRPSKKDYEKIKTSNYKPETRAR